MPTPNFDARYRMIAFWAILGLALLAAGYLIGPFIGAILWAGVLSVLTAPVYARLRKRCHESLCAAITVLGTLALIVLPLTLIAILIVAQVGAMVRELQAAQPGQQQAITLDTFTRGADEALAPVLQRLGFDFSLTEWLHENRDEIVRRLTGPIGQAVFVTGFTVFTLVIALLTMFFMLRDGHRLRDPVLELIPLPRETASRILLRMRDTIWAVFMGVVLVAMIQGALAGLMYYVLGVPGALLLGAATLVLCIIPLLGAPVIYIPMAVVLAAQGQWWQAAVMLGFGWFVISLVDNVLRPFFIGARTNLHPMAVFFSLIGGLFAMGPVGVMAGPVLLTVLLAIADVVREARNLAQEPSGDEGGHEVPVGL
jgi:predicted PurR-regulated permease PerM